jgi:hypothetical protein
MIKLTGPDGYDSAFLIVTDPKFSSGQSSVNLQGIALPIGEYQVRITLQKSQYIVRVYARME